MTLEQIVEEAERLSLAGVHWWDYDKVPLLADMIRRLAKELMSLQDKRNV